MEEVVDVQSLFQSLMRKVLRIPGVKDDDDVCSLFGRIDAQLSSLMKLLIKTLLNPSSSSSEKGVTVSASSSAKRPKSGEKDADRPGILSRPSTSTVASRCRPLPPSLRARRRALAPSPAPDADTQTASDLLAAVSSEEAAQSAIPRSSGASVSNPPDTPFVDAALSLALASSRAAPPSSSALVPLTSASYTPAFHVAISQSPAPLFLSSSVPTTSASIFTGSVYQICVSNSSISSPSGLVTPYRSQLPVASYPFPPSPKSPGRPSHLSSSASIDVPWLSPPLTPSGRRYSSSHEPLPPVSLSFSGSADEATPAHATPEGADSGYVVGTPLLRRGGAGGESLPGADKDANKDEDEKRIERQMAR